MAADDKDKVWNVYFRLPSDDGEWQFDGFVPQMIVETFETDEGTSPGDQFDNKFPGILDIGELLAARWVCRNQSMGIESRYHLGKPGNGLIKRTGKPTSVIFNCKLYH